MNKYIVTTPVAHPASPELLERDRKSVQIETPSKRIFIARLSIKPQEANTIIVGLAFNQMVDVRFSSAGDTPTATLPPPILRYLTEAAIELLREGAPHADLRLSLPCELD